MKLKLFFIFSLAILLLGQAAAAEGNTIIVGRDSFCADVERLKLANAELLGSVLGLEWGTAIFENRSQMSLPNTRAANELAISAAKGVLDATDPFLELCAPD
ncbi:hypothetical protein [Yoonia vestfoldensis]|uniref:hypothetical protein n=1 Tax=Yoonia vestfoldensis TaxID=245188 RepID=UPI00035E2436|nr:hypothetical protein [Yoonia vestfoldensis]